MSEVDKASDAVTCPCCGTVFSLDQIPGHPDLEPIGMQFDREESRFSLFYFNHVVPGCHSTLAIEALKFSRFITEPVSDELLYCTESCEMHCLKIKDLQECGTECMLAPYRRFLVSMMALHKAVAQAKRNADRTVKDAQP